MGGIHQFPTDVTTRQYEGASFPFPWRAWHSVMCPDVTFHVSVSDHFPTDLSTRQHKIASFIFISLDTGMCPDVVTHVTGMHHFPTNVARRQHKCASSLFAWSLGHSVTCVAVPSVAC
jgi:hypothetical protein